MHTQTLSSPAGTVARAALALLAAAAVALASLTLVSAAPAAANATSAEQSFTSEINAARAEAGLPSLSTSSSLVAVARAWAESMARQSKLYHNPSLTSQVDNWRWVGENVGYGPDAETVHVAFMNSPGHRANILDSDYSEVGVGTAIVDGRVWVAEVFRRPMTARTTADSAGATASSTATPGSFERRLTYGSTGSAVKRVQARLGINPTGFYGSLTKAAVSRFQKSQGWAGRGSVGRRTWSLLF